MPANTARPAAASATARLSGEYRRPGLRRGSERGLRARPALSASASSASPSWRRTVSRSKIPRRRCSASRKAAARRCGSTWCACRRSRRSRDYLKSGWIENVDANSIEDVTINGFPAATATAKGDQWLFRLYAVRFGSEVYRFIFAREVTTAETDRAFPRFDQQLPPHDAHRESKAPSRCASRW